MLQDVLAETQTTIQPLVPYLDTLRWVLIAIALIGIAVFIACVLLAARGSEVDLPKFFENINRFPKYIYETLPTLRLASLGADLAEWYWGLKGWLKLLWQTVLIAYVGTILGAAGAFLFCFAAAANLGRASWLRFTVRRYLEFCRTVPEIVFALIFVIAFGLGPLPGVLAIAIHTMGALGKLFSEVVENIDLKPVDGVTAAGRRHERPDDGALGRIGEEPRGISGCRDVELRQGLRRGIQRLPVHTTREAGLRPVTRHP